VIPSFEELSRRSVSGELSAPEREALEKYLREDPRLRAEHDWDEAFHAKLDEKIGSMPAMPGWERTQAALRAQAEAPRTAGILDRLSERLSAWLGFPFNAQAVAAALVVIQAGVIGVYAWQFHVTDYSDVRGSQPDAMGRAASLRVSFKPDVREADMRNALAEIDGEIVGGPGQLGVYLVRIKEGNPATAAQRLRARGITVLVEIVGKGR